MIRTQSLVGHRLSEFAIGKETEKPGINVLFMIFKWSPPVIYHHHTHQHVLLHIRKIVMKYTGVIFVIIRIGIQPATKLFQLGAQPPKIVKVPATPLLVS